MSASPPSDPHTVALPVSPASVLVLGNGASALQLGRALFVARQLQGRVPVGTPVMPMLGVPWRVAPLMLKVSDAPFAWLATRHFLAVEGEVGELIPLDGHAMEMAVDASCGEVMRLALGHREDAPCAVGLAQQLKATGRLFASPSELHSVEVV